MPVTLISHFWNEEFLLPFWLRHHRDIFDRGVLVDHQSDDRSLEIVRDMVPSWRVIKSKNQTFDATDLWKEMQAVEAEISGWNMVAATWKLKQSGFAAADSVASICADLAEGETCR